MNKKGVIIFIFSTIICILTGTGVYFMNNNKPKKQGNLVNLEYIISDQNSFYETRNGEI